VHHVGSSVFIICIYIICDGWGLRLAKMAVCFRLRHRRNSRVSWKYSLEVSF